MIKGQEREITSRGDRNGRAGAIERNQGEKDERADRPTGTRKKEGGAWTANSRERIDSKRGRESTDSSDREED